MILTVRLLSLTSRTIDGAHEMMYKRGQRMCLALILIRSKLCWRLQIIMSWPLMSSIYETSADMSGYSSDVDLVLICDTDFLTLSDTWYYTLLQFEAEYVNWSCTGCIWEAKLHWFDYVLVYTATDQNIADWYRSRATW